MFMYKPLRFILNFNRRQNFVKVFIVEISNKTSFCIFFSFSQSYTLCTKRQKYAKVLLTTLSLEIELKTPQLMCKSFPIPGGWSTLSGPTRPSQDRS